MARHSILSVGMILPLAVTLIGCGRPGGGTSSPDARQVVANALASRFDQQAKTARYAMEMHSPGSSFPNPDIHADGIADYQHMRYHSTVRADPLGARTVLNDETYTTSTFEYERGSQHMDGGKWHRYSYNSGDLQLNIPENLLVGEAPTPPNPAGESARRQQVESLLKTIDTVATESIRGTPTTHYHVGLYTDRPGSSGPSVDMWLDDHGRTRKMVFPHVVDIELWDLDAAPSVDLPSEVVSVTHT